MKVFTVALMFAGLLGAQTPNPTQGRTEVVTLDKQPLYRVTVVSKTAKAINYRHRSGATKVNFAGTALMPKSRGEAKVESKQGYIEIEVEFDNISGGASQFGPEYLTYVLWAISPEGRAVNLGEVLLNGTKSKLNVSSDLQAFGMIVTAEPYFSVTQPSDVVVMENVVRADTLGKVEEITANYELLQRGSYVFNVDRDRLKPMAMDPKIPIELYEARNAVQIARWTGADKYAAESFTKAEALLKQAEDYQIRKQKKPVSMTAREAVQTAEDARAIALKRMAEERLAMERQSAMDRENKAKADAAEAARQRTLAEEQQRAEAARRAQAEEQSRLDAQRRAAAEQQAQTQSALRIQAEEQARLAAEKAKLEAETVRQLAAKERAEAEAARLAAVAQQQAAQQDAERARLAAGEADKARLAAEQDKEKLRQQLLQQFNLILETRDSARGLIVNMSDVLFDTGKYTLRPAAREKLAKIAGIILAHPGLHLEVEGHTDSVGGEAYNQRLSEQRADAVRQYLVGNGLPTGGVVAKGFGKTMPVASNDTAAGRQQNRRVELVVSGEVIGTKLTDIRTMPSSR
ncbi:MAG TPA: OmpA family protein [Bryobacteraceae bacterium]|nr:OmpA family protein [Bryobacteraceae bacterium]